MPLIPFLADYHTVKIFTLLCLANGRKNSNKKKGQKEEQRKAERMEGIKKTLKNTQAMYSTKIKKHKNAAST